MPLSVQEIDRYARGAGFSGSPEYWADAIAEAESSGDPQAYNPETAANTPAGQGSYGLWQIYRYAHPQYSVAQLLTPAGNASAAYAVSSQGTNFTPWTTYNTGAAANVLPSVEQQLGVNPGGVPSLGTPAGVTSTNTSNACTPPTNALDPIGWFRYSLCLAGKTSGGVASTGGSVAQAIWESFLSLVGPVLERIGFFTLAVLAILIGVILIAWEPLKDTAKTAVKVAPLVAS